MRWSTKWLNDRKAAKHKWHLWFAWYPVRMSADGFEFRWLETVARRRMIGGKYFHNDPSIITVEKVRKSCEEVSCGGGLI